MSGPSTIKSKSQRSGPARGLWTLIAMVATSGLTMVGGCVSVPPLVDNPQYPPVRQVKVVDVQVLRDETEISLTNTTAEDLPAGLLWINGWFSRRFDGLPVGRSVTLSLGEFADRYGGLFRQGGFFATEFPDRVVLVQIQPAAPAADGKATLKQELIGMVVIRPLDQ